MTKQVISLSLEDKTIKLLDEASMIFSGNRSKFIDWLATRDFFLPQELIDRAKDLKSSVTKIESEVKQP